MQQSAQSRAGQSGRTNGLTRWHLRSSNAGKSLALSVSSDESSFRRCVVSPRTRGSAVNGERARGRPNAKRQQHFPAAKSSERSCHLRTHSVARSSSARRKRAVPRPCFSLELEGSSNLRCEIQHGGSDREGDAQVERSSDGRFSSQGYGDARKRSQAGGRASAEA